MLNTAQPNTEHHQAWLLDDGTGNLSGAIIPMTEPLSSVAQWQKALDTIFSEAVFIDPEADINGMYVITFLHDDNPQHNGLIFSRIRPDIAAGYDSRLPENPLGLVTLSTDSEGTRIAIAALTGGVTPDGTIRPNRTLCSIIDRTGKLLKDRLTRPEQLAIKAIGRFLHGRLDRHLESTRG